MTTHTNQQTETPRIKITVEELPAGRARVMVDGGALEHADQLDLRSERQRLRFAQASEAKVPGCFAEVLRLLEAKALQQRTSFDPASDDGCRFVFTAADKFLPEPIDWLWERYIPAGAVTILEGDPGVGKSLLLADLAARISRGFLAPDRNPAFDEPGHDPDPQPELVWWFSGEDDFARTTAPRLRAAGADLSLIRVVEGTEDMKKQKCRAVSFPDDFVSLWKSRAAAPRLVVIDPLSAFCGGAHNHQAAQKAFTELTRFASATGAAIIITRPLNRRSTTSPSDRTAGPSLLSASRSALLLAPHPTIPSHLVLAPLKTNYCSTPPSLELSIIDSLPASPDPLASLLRQDSASLLRQQGEAPNNQPQPISQPHEASQERERLESFHQTPVFGASSPLSDASPERQNLLRHATQVLWLM